MPQSEPNESDPNESGPNESNTAVFRLHVVRQIVTAVQPPGDEAAAESESTEDSGDSAGSGDAAADRASGALSAWAGLTGGTDTVEAMIAAQIVATHDLSMMAIGRAIRRASETGYFGGYINDACKVARVALGQIETLARYRTWRMRTNRDAAAGDM